MEIGWTWRAFHRGTFPLLTIRCTLYQTIPVSSRLCPVIAPDPPQRRPSSAAELTMPAGSANTLTT
jgi:hypothetical protein